MSTVLDFNWQIVKEEIERDNLYPVGDKLDPGALNCVSLADMQEFMLDRDRNASFLNLYTSAILNKDVSTKIVADKIPEPYVGDEYELVTTGQYYCFLTSNLDLYTGIYWSWIPFKLIGPDYIGQGAWKSWSGENTVCRPYGAEGVYDFAIKIPNITPELLDVGVNESSYFIDFSLQTTYTKSNIWNLRVGIGFRVLQLKAEDQKYHPITGVFPLKLVQYYPYNWQQPIVLSGNTIWRQALLSTSCGQLQNLALQPMYKMNQAIHLKAEISSTKFAVIRIS